ncbi:MAG: 3-deoxy-manno-octulosonate cytidylyltransferase, partial [Caldimonas sp.]
RRAGMSGASSVVVAADDDEIIAACARHGVAALLTRADHASGTDRVAEACTALGFDADTIVVNVQGDEPMLPPALVDAVAALLAARSECVMSTAAHAIAAAADFDNANIVKVVVDAAGRALYFSRAPIPWPRDARAAGESGLNDAAPLRHVGLYAYRAGFLRRFSTLARSPLEDIERLEQLRALWHGERIAVHVSEAHAGIGIDTADDLERARCLFAANDGAGFA